MMDKSQNKQTGNAGEEAAANYLESQGYKILKRNYNLKFGEIDILAQHKGSIVIAEVKTVKGSGFGIAQDLVRYQKQVKLRLLASALEQEYPGRTIRIDVIGVNMGTTPPHIEHIVSAVT